MKAAVCGLSQPPSAPLLFAPPFSKHSLPYYFSPQSLSRSLDWTHPFPASGARLTAAPPAFMQFLYCFHKPLLR